MEIEKRETEEDISTKQQIINISAPVHFEHKAHIGHDAKGELTMEIYNGPSKGAKDILKAAEEYWERMSSDELNSPRRFVSPSQKTPPLDLSPGTHRKDECDKTNAEEAKEQKKSRLKKKDICGPIHFRYKAHIASDASGVLNPVLYDDEPLDDTVRAVMRAAKENLEWITREELDSVPLPVLQKTCSLQVLPTDQQRQKNSIKTVPRRSFSRERTHEKPKKCSPTDLVKPAKENSRHVARNNLDFTDRLAGQNLEASALKPPPTPLKPANLAKFLSNQNLACEVNSPEQEPVPQSSPVPEANPVIEQKPVPTAQKQFGVD